MEHSSTTTRLSTHFPLHVLNLLDINILFTLFGENHAINGIHNQILYLVRQCLPNIDYTEFIYRNINSWDEEEGTQHSKPHLVRQWIVQTLPLRLLAGFGHGKWEVREFIGVGEVMSLSSDSHHYMVDRTNERYTLSHLFGCLRGQVRKQYISVKESYQLYLSAFQLPVLEDVSSYSHRPKIWCAEIER